MYSKVFTIFAAFREPFHANWTTFKTLSSSTISDFNEIGMIMQVPKGRHHLQRKFI